LTADFAPDAQPTTSVSGLAVEQNLVKISADRVLSPLRNAHDAS